VTQRFPDLSNAAPFILHQNNPDQQRLKFPDHYYFDYKNVGSSFSIFNNPEKKELAYTVFSSFGFHNPTY
jgi:hypothetical protein